MSASRIIIIGGGASGVLLAAQLLRTSGDRLKIALIERRGGIGRGIAYNTEEPDHILNTRVGSMSAYADDPEHFWRWIQASEAAKPFCVADTFCFVPRKLYRRYLEELVEPWLKHGGDGRLEIIHGECVDVTETDGGVAATLASGESHMGHIAVLATGHHVPSFSSGNALLHAWVSPEEAGIQEEAAVLILGTGLSMIDCAIQLINSGHRGPITALSRRGLLPLPHKRSQPIRIDPADIPFGTDPAYLLHWFRETVRWATERGGDWRDVVDGIRPYTRQIWQSLSPGGKQRFLRHARTFWEIHRHRLPPESDLRVRLALQSGRLEILAGRFLGMEQQGAGPQEGGSLTVRFRRRGSRAVESRSVNHVIDCTGILRDPADHGDALITSLLARGIARRDPLGIGIEVDGRCAVIDRQGTSRRRIFAVGPVTRAQFWEVTSIPDIRNQCAALGAEFAAQR
ncbi:Uncharacterized NAD(P)/FAD-binding protein YdhS [Faunimonas pinastri]|uniref:Uncharacterized NAD(P)/FAD-binding protein YdhS n=1 Tax=Faunimonas pinastri TaxID=1855383 RepID=A0A1H9K2Q5_9HYPH|nr:FAD/NAD(P)-binding protein [Faunimonas pinastri]SEQ93370.1 Uncharacterized NAD(P)/FAD-binding protein YdhS [Faunimonas pinastri]